jgi:gamma-glutamylcyclotransferase
MAPGSASRSMSSRGFWGGATASLAEAPGESVEGLAVPMLGAARGLVEHKEGAISGLYEPVEVKLEPVGGERVAALAYRAAPARRLPADTAPAAPFLDVIRAARARGLSAEWIAGLERLRAGAAQSG